MPTPALSRRSLLRTGAAVTVGTAVAGTPPTAPAAAARTANNPSGR